jgi:Protein of unknown function (DUF3443)
MDKVTRWLGSGLAFLLILSATSCGGGNPPGSGSSSSTGSVAAASNVVSVVVDSGPTTAAGSVDSVNTLFMTVTICVPGSTTECQTIDHIQVDTGSYGLRILAPVLTLALPVTTASDGNSLVECTQFVDGYSWGPVALADVQVSGETASSLPIQVIGSSNFTTVPDACSGTGPSNTAEDTVAAFGANGILGIGALELDCGASCVSNAANGDYYSCSATACVGITASLANQVPNPVSRFTTDNNGTIIDLPTVAAAGAATVTGSLIFGIDTQANNASGTQTVLTLAPSSSQTIFPGNFTITFDGQPLSESFIDSGTNGIYFNDNNLVQCSEPDFTGFYCPSSTQTFTATLMGENAVSTTATFSVGNAQTIFTDNPTFAALPAIAGTYSSSSETFDWGLAFYYGRRVATAIEDHTTSVGTGPYVAF